MQNLTNYINLGRSLVESSINLSESQEQIRYQNPSLFPDVLNISSSNEEKKLITTLPPSKEEIEKEIESKLQELEQINTEMQKIEEKAVSGQSTQTLITTIQYWVDDIVLKGGASSANGAISFFIESPSLLQELNFITRSIKSITDFVENIFGHAAFIIQSRILQIARARLAELKENHDLNSDQEARFIQLAKKIEFEENSLFQKWDVQILKSIKNSFSVVVPLFSYSSSAIAATILSASGGILSFFDIALQSHSFYQNKKNIKIHQNWSHRFKSWIQEKRPSVNLSDIQEAHQTISELQKKRKIRQEQYFNTFKEKFDRKEITIESIQERIVKFKMEGLECFLEHLKVQDFSSEEFQHRLEEKIGISLPLELTNSIYNAYLCIHEIKEAKTLSMQGKEHALKEIRNLLSPDIEACIRMWMKGQSDDSLLKFYMEYHSIIDISVKSALVEMVKKKHQIEKSFLKRDLKFTGTKLSVISLVSITLLSLAIVGSVLSYGIAPWIAIMLASLPSVVGGILTTTSYYYAYQQKPALITSMLNSSYLRLAYYQSAAFFSSINEQIENYVAKIWKEKKNQLITLIGHQTLFGKSLIKNSSQIETDLQNAQSKAEKWIKKVETLQEELKQIAWRDFANAAHLQVKESIVHLDPHSHAAFDTLKALNDALNHSDLCLLSDETKELLEKQLGINLLSLEMELKKDPLAIKELIRKFFNLKDGEYMRFIGQQAHLHL